MERVKMINALTGSEMWVTRDRVYEYRIAGHRQAGSLFRSNQVIQERHTEEPPKEPVKKPEKAPHEKPTRKAVATSQQKKRSRKS